MLNTRFCGRAKKLPLHAVVSSDEQCCLFHVFVPQSAESLGMAGKSADRCPDMARA